MAGLIDRVLHPLRRKDADVDDPTLRYHRWQNAEAVQKYDVLVAQEGIRPLTPAEHAEIEEFARDSFGSSLYAPWLKTFAVARGGFRPGFTPDTYVGLYWVRYLVGENRLLLNRVNQRATLQTDLVPDLLYRKGGRLVTPEGTPVPRDRLAEVIFARGERAYLKGNETGQGKGITVLRRGDFHPNMLPDHGEYAVQYEVRHAPHYDDFAAGKAAATLRITTVMTARGPETRDARIRFGRPHLDYVVSGAGVTAAVDPSSGRVAPRGTANSWTFTEVHPDTGARFADLTIPGYREMAATCEALHARVPQLGWLGWDVCPQEGGGCMIYEVNAGFSGIKYGEAMQGPLFHDLDWHRFHHADPLEHGRSWADGRQG